MTMIESFLLKFVDEPQRLELELQEQHFTRGA